MTRKRKDPFYYEGVFDYIKALEDWFYPELQRAYDEAVLPDGKWRLFMGIVVYGAYVDRFLDLCVPALLAPGNRVEDATLVVHTDEANAVRIQERLDGFPAKVEVYAIPDYVIGKVKEHPANKYWLLGAVHNLHIQMAKYRAHSYHMLMPDHIYSENYFSNLVRLAKTKHAIVQNCLSARLEDISASLKRRNCRLPAKELNALAMDYMHPQQTPFVMNNRSDLPESLFLLYVADHVAEVICPHNSIVYLSHDVLMRSTLRLFNTIDGQLPFFIPDDVEAYVPRIEDDMSYIELSDRGKPYSRAEGTSVVAFCVKFWITAYCHAGHERFFNLTTLCPLPDDYEHPFLTMDREAIEASKADIRKHVHESRQAIFDVLPQEFRSDPIPEVSTK